MKLHNAKYTLFLKDLIDDPYMKEAIDKAMSTYPLYEKVRTKDEYIPTYIPTREELNKKILNHYKYREIGFETPGRFIDELEITLNEIMPYYNQLFFSTDQDYNLLYNVDYTKEITINREGNDEFSNNGTSKTNASDESNTNANVNSYSKRVNVDTPQNDLNIGETEINNLEYAESMGFDKTSSTDTGSTSGSSNTSSENESSGNAKSNQKESHIETTKGNYGQVTFQSLLEKYRDLIINVEQKIINDERIRELFMKVF